VSPASDSYTPVLKLTKTPISYCRNMEPLGSELFRQSAASYERTFWVPSTDEQGKETIVRDRRVQSFPEYLEIEDGCTLGLQQGEL
jgi:hypothetical protein